MGKMVKCIKLGKEAEGLDAPPWPGELGQKVLENVSKEAWLEWMRLQTMIINEQRISPLDPEARSFIAQEMEKYFFGDGIEMPEGYVAPQNQE